MSTPSTWQRANAWSRTADPAGTGDMGGAAGNGGRTIPMDRSRTVQPPQQRTGGPGEWQRSAQDGADADPVPALRALPLAEVRKRRRTAQQEEADLSYVRRLLQGRIDLLDAELVRREGVEGGEGAESAERAECSEDVDAGVDAEATGHGADLADRAAPAVQGLRDGAGRPAREAVSGASGAEAGRDAEAAVTGGEPTGPADEFAARLSGILADQPAPRRSSARHVHLATPHGEAYRRIAGRVLAEIGLSDTAARTDEELSSAAGRLRACEQQVSGRRQEIQRAADTCGAEITRRYREGEAHVDDLLQ